MGATIAGIDLGFNLPTFASSGIGFWITVASIAVLFVICMGLIAWWYLQKKLFYIQIRDFENIAGQGFQLAARDTARVLKVGDGGEEILYLKKRKQYRAAYGKKMGRNEYWFARGQDGYWYNFLLGDLDAKRGMLDIEPVDRDLRYSNASMRELVRDRYKKKNINTATAIVVGGIVLSILIMFVGNWFVLSKLGDLIVQANQLQAANGPTLEAIKTIAGHIDTICSGGGLVPA